MAVWLPHVRVPVLHRLFTPRVLFPYSERTANPCSTLHLVLCCTGSVEIMERDMLCKP